MTRQKGMTLTADVIVTIAPGSPQRLDARVPTASCSPMLGYSVSPLGDREGTPPPSGEVTKVVEAVVGAVVQPA